MNAADTSSVVTAVAVSKLIHTMSLLLMFAMNVIDRRIAPLNLIKAVTYKYFFSRTSNIRKSSVC